MKEYTEDSYFMIPFKWNVNDQWFPGTNTGGWGDLHRGKRKLWGGGRVLYDDCGGGGGDVFVMYTVYTFVKTYWTLHVCGCILCLNYTLIKLFLGKKIISPKPYSSRVWLRPLTCFTNSLPDFSTVLDKVMTVFSSEKPVQLFLKRKAQWKKGFAF